MNLKTLVGLSPWGTGILREEWPITFPWATDASLGSSLWTFHSLSPLQWEKGKGKKNEKFHIYAASTSSLILNRSAHVDRKRRWSHCGSAGFVEHGPSKYTTVLEASESHSQQATWKDNYSIVPNLMVPLFYIRQHRQGLQCWSCLCALFLTYALKHTFSKYSIVQLNKNVSQEKGHP